MRMTRWPEPTVGAGSFPRSGEADDAGDEFDAQPSRAPVNPDAQVNPEAQVNLDAQLHHAHAPMLRRFLTPWTGGDQRATETLVAETLRRAARTSDHPGSDDGAVSAWLLTLARRVAIDYTRSQPARGRAADRAAERGTGRAGSLLSGATDAQVTQAIEQLDDDDRLVIAELFYRGRSVSEAATVLGLDQAVISRRALRALQTLRQTIAAATEGRS